jgi:hypothetical protein
LAKYKGKTVRLNKPSRITKGQPGFGRKKFKVFVKAGSKVKKENHLGQDIIVVILALKQKQDIGLARNGKVNNGSFKYNSILQ